MTNHYIIHILETSTYFKVTYRDNSFKQVTHLRGTFNAAMLKQIGRLLPRLEADFEKFKTEFINKVTYTKEETTKSLYTEFVDAWHIFYEDFVGMPLNFTGTDGKSIKGIIAHLTKITTTETEALALWKIILQKWDTLNEFHKQYTDLKYINSKLNVILHALKQQNNTVASGTNGSVEL